MPRISGSILVCCEYSSTMQYKENFEKTDQGRYQHLHIAHRQYNESINPRFNHHTNAWIRTTEYWNFNIRPTDMNWNVERSYNVTSFLRKLRACRIANECSINPIQYGTRICIQIYSIPQSPFPVNYGMDQNRDRIKMDRGLGRRI